MDPLEETVEAAGAAAEVMDDMVDSEVVVVKKWKTARTGIKCCCTPTLWVRVCFPFQHNLDTYPTEMPCRSNGVLSFKGGKCQQERK
jgi:hypothetical protein